MPTRVLVVNHDIDLADEEVDSLRRRGYDVTECGGPIGAHCPILAGRPCSLADVADVLVYDAWSTGEPDGARRLIEGLRDIHPNVPVVLTGQIVEIESGGQTGRQRHLVPSYIYVLEGILTTNSDGGPVGVDGVQYHGAGQS